MKKIFHETVRADKAGAAMSQSVSVEISIRMRHPSYSVDEIAVGIGQVPDVAHRVGALRANRRGDLQGGMYAETYLVYRPFDTLKSTEGAIERANLWVKEREEFLSFFREKGGVLEYYLTLEIDGIHGFVLEPSLLSECSVGHQLGY